MTTTLIDTTAEVVATRVAMLTAMAKQTADLLAAAKNEFIALGVAEVVLSDGTKVSAIDSPTRDFDMGLLETILTAEAMALVTKTTVSAAQFDAARTLGKVPAEADAAISMNPRTIVKVNQPRA